jgi:hypothetical protein
MDGRGGGSGGIGKGGPTQLGGRSMDRARLGIRNREYSMLSYRREKGDGD